MFGNVDNHSTIAPRGDLRAGAVGDPGRGRGRRRVEIANDTIYGLNASVFTNDLERAYSTARSCARARSATTASGTDFGIAFGGFKQSGLGREGGREGLVPYLETKVLILDGMPGNAGRVAESQGH